jgi:glutathione synthase/RimK-type ligase-like ATP-grasp enzyme
MSILLVVERSEDWPLEIPGVSVVPARDYLADPLYSSGRHKVFNLCKSYRYQSLGYYVSLLAEARGHRPLPSVGTMQDLKLRSLVRFVSEDLEELVEHSLAPLLSDEFTLSIYFSRNVAKRYRRLSLQLFNQFPAPLLRAWFARQDGLWKLERLRPIAAKDIPPEHQAFVVQAATDYFTRPRTAPKKTPWRYDLAILVEPEAHDAPSNERALQRFVKAAQGLGLRAELITRDDLGRLAEFDALLIRATTQVDDYTYRFSRRAAAEGLVVIDDPESILRCTNKVYLAELLARARVPIPKTVVVHRDNLTSAAGELGFPSILKLPDSSFSQGVTRADDRAAFEAKARRFLEDSDLVIAQEFLPTEFDWRIGILDRQALWACKYHMAPAHWQIVKRDSRGRERYGKVDSLPLSEVPPKVLDTALKAANLIGDGLYGVDLKQTGHRIYVIEINDNPNLDAGYEDSILGEELYTQILQVIVQRIERRKAQAARTEAAGASAPAPESTAVENP